MKSTLSARTLIVVGAAVFGTFSIHSPAYAAGGVWGHAQIRELTDAEVAALRVRPEESLSLAPAHEMLDLPTQPVGITDPVNPCSTGGLGGITPFVPLEQVNPAPSPSCTPTPISTAHPLLPLPPVVGPGTIIGDVGQGVVIIDKILNIGKEIWQFIKDGHAVANIDTQSANALPAGVKGPMDLAGWQPKSKNYQIIIPNSRGQNVEFVFRVSYWFGGTYQGKGLFLSNIAIQPSDFKVNWGTTLNVRARVPSDGIVNAGTTEDPIAGALIYIDWSRQKVFSTTGSSAVLYVRGDGQIQDMSDPDNDQPENINPIGTSGNP